MSHLKANRRARVYANKGGRASLGATDRLVPALVIIFELRHLPLAASFYFLIFISLFFSLSFLLFFFFAMQRPSDGSRAEGVAQPCKYISHHHSATSHHHNRHEWQSDL